MSGTVYDIYTRGKNGRRSGTIRGYTDLKITERANSPTKWSLSGFNNSGVPLEGGESIVIFRDGQPLLSGYVDSVSEEYDASANYFTWSIDGYDDLNLLSYRIIYPEPWEDEIDANYVYADKGNIVPVLLNLIRYNAGDRAKAERQIRNLEIMRPVEMGQSEIRIAESMSVLWDIIDEKIGDQDAVGIKQEWNARTGKFEIRLYEPRDLSDKLVFSAEHGTLKKWKRTVTAPKANVIYAGGYTPKTEIESEVEGEEKEVIYGPQQFITVTDNDSIAKWGRREKYTNFAESIKPIETTDENGEVIATEEDESVLQRLKDAAQDELLGNQGKEAYTFTLAEVDRAGYKTVWDTGDLVGVLIRGELIKARITQTVINYKDGVETVTPTIGSITRGVFESLYDDLGRLKKRISILDKTGTRSHHLIDQTEEEEEGEE